MMSQKTDTMIKLALVFTISLLSFSVGTYVGKMYSDNQHKLAQLEPKDRAMAGQKDVAATHSEGAVGTTEAERALGTTTATGQETTLTDSEVAKIAEEFATDDDTTSKSIESIGESETEIKTISAAPKATVKTMTAAANDQLKKMEIENRIPASIPARKEIVPMQFTVQVGAFPTDNEAQKMTKDLLAKGFKTSVVAAQVNGTTWYRVNVGLFGSIKEAQDYKASFLEKTQLASAFVQKVQK